ncbi:hypothetical protein QE152_g8922 [Popillia japonica]|uniref:Uncharacterized protein n=1 Tax=Popillia japonica TaxID=7064 RepID=A0AAW1LWH7_POPJA
MAASATHLINESQKEQELQRRHQQEQILQQQQKLQELQGQINAQYSSVVNTPQSLMFFPLLEHLRGLQQPATLPPGVPKSPIPNHLLPPHQVTNWLATAHLAQIVEKHSPPMLYLATSSSSSDQLASDSSLSTNRRKALTATRTIAITATTSNGS